MYDAGKHVQLESVKLLENITKAQQVSVSGKRQIGSVVSPVMVSVYNSIKDVYPHCNSRISVEGNFCRC